MNLDLISQPVGVLGAGVMGKQISVLCAMHGFRVVLWEPQTRPELAKEVARVVSLEARRTAIPREMVAEIQARITTVKDITELTNCFLIIEAVAEDFAIKKEVLGNVSNFLSETSIIATNTSTLSVTGLAAAISSPERFAGTHFFNPPTSMELVEVAKTNLTSNKTISRILDFLQMLQKTGVVVQDSPGFIVNRIIFPMINEAIFALGEGIGDAGIIDKCIRLGARHPLGPLELADLIGLDVCLSIIETLFRETGDPKYRPAPLLREYIRSGKLGKKTGSGFYTYRSK